MGKTVFLLGTGIVLAGLGLSVWWQGSRSAATQVSERRSTPKSTLGARLVVPLSDSGEEIVTRPGESVEFVYALHNAGTSPLENPRVMRLCGCKVTRELPSHILPGETAHLGFKLLAPQAGVHRQALPIAADGSATPLVVLQPSLRVKLEAPRIIHVPPRVVLSAIRGEEPNSHEVLITTIEGAESGAFITELQCHPAELVEIRLIEMREKPDFDDRFLRRTYRFAVQPIIDNTASENAAGVLVLKSRRKNASDIPQIPLQLRLLEPVQLAPERLSLKISAGTQPRPQQVIVLRRGSERPAVQIKEYDHTLVHVESTSPPDLPVEMFSVVAQPDAPSRRTQLVFAIGNGEQELILPVQLISGGHGLD